jgi:hypothetical protein
VRFVFSPFDEQGMSMSIKAYEHERGEFYFLQMLDERHLHLAQESLLFAAFCRAIGSKAVKNKDSHSCT